jgi:hypothetical protein
LSGLGIPVRRPQNTAFFKANIREPNHEGYALSDSVIKFKPQIQIPKQGLSE